MALNKTFFVFVIVAFMVLPLFVWAENEPKIILFYGEECPHCHTEKDFLKDLKKEIPSLVVEEYEVWHNSSNAKLFGEMAKDLGVEILAVPFTIVGDRYLLGFDKPENSGEKIRMMVGNLTGQQTVSGDDKEEKFNIPILGDINIRDFSLPTVAVVLGALDGFNPCSMWSLFVLLTLVIATGSRRKVWLAGSVFILTSAVSYFLFMATWLNVFAFLEYLVVIRIIVGLVAVAVGVISVREFYRFKPNVCEITTPEKQRKISERVKKVLSADNILVMVAGVVMVALSVNVIEMLCSLGIPVVFTKILTMSGIETWKYYAYIGLYDFFYMLDDIVVLLVAGFSMKFLKLDSRYSRYSRLVAGILMLILGLIFLLKPGLLMSY